MSPCLALSLVLALGGPRFEDVAESSGVRFRFETGSRGRHDLPEIMGGGVALIDADGDGRLDVYLCNGGPILPDHERPAPPCRLFLNRGGWRFADVTETAGAPGPSYAMGAAVGDFDGDGLDDLLVTGWRDQRLYRNLGGGRFADVTERAGLTSDRWSTSAAFADLDGDGDLDLYVCGYLDYDPAAAPFCAAPDGRRDFCGPEGFPAQADRLYRNNGDGTFADVSRASGIDRPGEAARALGVLVADLTGDARLDLYVANDGTPCRLFENLGDLRFRDVAAESGVAVDGRGEPLAGMGVALGDLDGDGRDDLLVSNFLGRSTIAYRSLGEGQYADASAALGLAAATRDVLGFGLGLADLDGDGDLDLLQANGHVLDRERLGVPLAMRPRLLRNDGGRLVDASADAGAWFARPILGRGVALGDLDGDGRPDAVVAALDAPAAVLRNTSAGRGLTVELAGHAVGAVVRATIQGQTTTRTVVGGGSYLSAPSRAVHFGLGDAPAVDRLEVAWPSGRVEVRDGPHAPGLLTWKEGAGARPSGRDGSPRRAGSVNSIGLPTRPARASAHPPRPRAEDRPMDCPRCKLMLRETDYEGVAADICDNCWGIWLDRGELEEVLDSHAMEFSDAERKQITSIRGESALPQASEPAPCPRCGRVMDVVHSDAGVQITLDRCPEHGVWLDTGEIKAVQAVAEKSAELHRLLIQKLGLGGA